MMLFDLFFYFFTLVGFAVVLYHVNRFVNIIKCYLGKTDYKIYGAGSDKWAVVTGSSDGIGKAFAVELAKKGFNIVLVSRTKSKLEDVAAEIAQINKLSKTQIVALDFSNPSQEQYDDLFNTVSKLPVTILVNNVGASLEYPKLFGEASYEENERIVKINVEATTKITYHLLPILEASEGKKLILNISSIGSAPSPLMATYAASKGYLDVFSKSLAAEYASRNIRVECILPAFVVSNMSKRSRPTASIPLPEKFVGSVLNTVGNLNFRSGFFVHDLFLFVREMVPDSVIIKQVKALHISIQKRAIAKQERLKKEEESKKGK